MKHIHHEHALTVLRAQPFSPDELRLIQAAADDLPWEALSPMVEALQHPQTAEAAKDAAYALISGADEAHRGLAGMCVFAAAMYGTGSRLRAQGIPPAVLADTFRCLHRMMGEYRQEFGRPGFDRGFWVWRQASGTLVRLGALEFEYLCAMSPQTARRTGLAEGEPYLSVHIPSGADLSREALDNAYAQARAFYREHPVLCLNQGRAPQAILCESWLLSPALLPLLGPQSGIRRFAQDYRLCDAESESRSCWHFLFMVSGDTPPEAMPERTSLQRAVKAHLMAGGGIGCGLGLLQDNPPQPK